MNELIFVDFVVRQEDEEPLAVFPASPGSLQHGIVLFRTILVPTSSRFHRLKLRPD
ncbi:hypothetical protein CPB85DRAFT_1271793 [Mucidula mucida]|nr:hypothetical protein CPB85DRAFT_1271793 [Mucidula mucida]